jgi:hypothetical protein
MSTLDFAPPPIFCPRCGREVQHLFCMSCMLSHLDSADLLANARQIRGMTQRPIGRLRAAAACAICTGSMATGERARLLPKGVVAHVRCVEQLIARLDEAMPRRELAPAGELPFDGEPLVVE